MTVVMVVIGMLAVFLMSHMSNRSMSTEQIVRMARVSEFFGNASGEANTIRTAFFSHGGLGQFLRSHRLQNPDFNLSDEASVQQVLHEFFASNSMLQDVEVRSVRLLTLQVGEGSHVQLRDLASAEEFDVAAIQIAPRGGSTQRTLEVLVAR